jgi:hypothetical protein
MSQQSFRTVIRTLALTFALSLSLGAQAAEWVVAAAAHAPGASGTNWRTDLRIINPGIAAANATLYLLPQNSDNSARTQHVAVTVPPLGQLSLTDVVAGKFGFTGSAALLVESTEAALVVTSRTYNEAANGSTYGQFIPGVPSQQALKPNEIGNLIYLVKSDEYRTNVGFAGTTGARATVAVTLRDATGHLLGSRAFDVPPYGQIQVNDIFGGVDAAAATVARAEVTTTANVIAYSSVIDNRTGDPIAMIAQRPSESRTQLVIPAVAHLAGANNSAWRSDVRIFNIGSDRSGDDDGGGAGATVTVSFYPANVANAAPQTKVFALAPLQLLALDDVLQTTFGGATSGALRIDSSQPLFVTSRTYNQTSGGTFGQDIPAIGLDGALASGSVARFSGLSNRGFRTNLGFFNAGTTAADLQLVLRGNDGAIAGQKTLHLEPSTMTQINDVFTYVGAGAAEGGSLTIAATGGSVLSYASVIDNASGDPVYVPGVLGAPSPQQPVTPPPPPPAGSTGCVTVAHIAAGRKASYRVTGAENFTMATTWLTDTDTSASETSLTRTSAGDSTIDTTYTYSVQNGLRALTRSISNAKTSAAGFDILVTTDSTFSSPMIIGPVSNWCSDTKWSNPAIVHTVVLGGTFPGPTTLINRPAADGFVIAVNETITVAAGTFNTIHYRGVQGRTDAKVQKSNVWLSINDGVLVKEDDLDAGGNVQTVVELTNLQ